MRREQEAAAERARREAPERERRAQEERERLAKEEAARQARFAAEQARGSNEENEARTKAERDAAERRARLACAPGGLRAALADAGRLAAPGRRSADRQQLEEARIAARRDEQRRQYEARARREVEIAVARRAAFDLRFSWWDG